MKKILVALSLLLSIALPANAQTIDATLSGTTCPGAGCLNIDVGNSGTIGLQITGTFSGTLLFEQTVDGSTWATWDVFPNGTVTPVTEATGAGLFFGPAAGARQVRVRFDSDYASGSAEVTMVRSSARRNSSGGGGAVSANDVDPGTFGTGTFTFDGGTAATSTPVLSGTQTWNNSGVTFVGQSWDVTNTNSAADSLLARWRVGSTTMFSIRKDGLLTTPHGLVAGTAISVGGGTDDGYYYNSSSFLGNRNFATNTGFDRTTIVFNNLSTTRAIPITHAIATSAELTTRLAATGRSGIMYMSGDADGQQVTLPKDLFETGHWWQFAVGITQTSNSMEVIPESPAQLLFEGNPCSSMTATAIGSYMKVINIVIDGSGSGNSIYIATDNHGFTCNP